MIVITCAGGQAAPEEWQKVQLVLAQIDLDASPQKSPREATMTVNWGGAALAEMFAIVPRSGPQERSVDFGQPG